VFAITEIKDAFWDCSLEDLKQGYHRDGESFVCLLCGETAEDGRIYPEDGFFYDARKTMERHIARAHGSAFDYLIDLDKKLTGLTEHQSRLLSLFYQGKSDDEVRRELGIGSASTIRNHRFVLKEKERQARLFLALMELLKEKDRHAPDIVPLHRTARMVDDRYRVTADETEKTLSRLFPEGPDGPLLTFRLKEKQRLIVLRELAKRFERSRRYAEAEVNEILEEAYGDYATLRRSLVDYGFLDRQPDGSEYWLKTETITESHIAHTKRREPDMTPKSKEERARLVAQYKEIPIEAGVYQIRNTVNGKLFVDTTRNLKSLNGRTSSLSSGTYPNKALQREWTEYGADAFALEVLEVLEPDDNPFVDVKDELKKLHEKWLEKLQPYGDKGYHKLK